MEYKNPNSTRVNPFRSLYDNVKFKSILDIKEKLPKFPFLCDIELTNHCNIRCIFCGQQAMSRPKGFMSWTVFKKVVDECAYYNAPIRFIRWGEPFLHKDIIDFCKYIKHKGLLSHITNNGVAIMETQMKQLIDLGVDSVIFSFQGASKEKYQLMRNNDLYQLLHSNILKMVKIRGAKDKPYIHISTTVTNESEKEISEFVSYWIEIVDSVGVGKTNLSRLSAHQIKSFEVIERLEELKEQETIKRVYHPCTEVYQKLSVDWDGKVSCCCGDYDNFLTVDDIHEKTLYEIWNYSPTLKIIRQLLDDSKHRSLTLCSTCYHTYEEF